MILQSGTHSSILNRNGSHNMTSMEVKLALSENLTERPLLRNFLHPLNREELDVGDRHPLGLQQQIPQVLIPPAAVDQHRSEEHTSELQSLRHLVCRLLLEKKKKRQDEAQKAIRSAGADTRATVDHPPSHPSAARLSARSPIPSHARSLRRFFFFF